MRNYHFTLSEHDPNRPWILVGEIKHLSISLDDDRSFFDWAAQEWPDPRYKVELDPWEQSPAFGRGANG